MTNSSVIQKLTRTFRNAQKLQPVAGAKIFASLYIGNRLFTIGFNQLKTDNFSKEYSRNDDDIYIHAEKCAIKRLHNILNRDEIISSKTILFVARAKSPYPESKFFIPGIAKPCDGCMQAIDEFKIKRVYYTLDDDNQNSELKLMDEKINDINNNIFFLKKLIKYSPYTLREEYKKYRNELIKERKKVELDIKNNMNNFKIEYGEYYA